MKFQAIEVNHNKLIKDYIAQEKKICSFFDYNPYQQHSFKQRLIDLTNRDFNREQLVVLLQTLYQKWGNNEAVLKQIDRLKEPNSVVVVGGQQAGLLTGPLYTIHKMVSIILFAKQQEKKLHVPVIPVFWIAGEDHDFDEINHIYQSVDNRLIKQKIGQFELERKSISYLNLDKKKLLEWLNQLFSNLTETDYSLALYQKLLNITNQAKTYVDFFAIITDTLLGDYGLVQFDSGDPLVKKFETSYLLSIVDKQEEIAANVWQQKQRLAGADYFIDLDLKQNDGHLFYLHQGSRVLLEREENGDWASKEGSVRFTKQELIAHIQINPESFSNNVVTRPLMQEYVFPTLTFFAGPGEIAYWAALQPGFHALGIKMPPVLPRLSFTLLDRTAEKMIEELGYDIAQIINQGLEEDKLRYLKSQLHPPIDALTEQIMLSIDAVHRPLRELAATLGSDLEGLAEENMELINKQISFLRKTIERRVKQKYQTELNKYDYLQALLRPNQAWQERFWNVIPFLNRYGVDWLDELLHTDFSFSKETHYLIKM
ncbi:bacillithiol biosynthesis cysteine-adding enzyme BshC [Amphibacillus marinus]|uniref:Putative cysteine ligase BshC n=1 Tax=Amphibacillus marinus TaxID=872970 RepID=A0A1H8I6M3_9BACI|nr:bacillithiol biosynthesis cysteine-adding enzyme BshC [Amphibacillus marinus]SEN63716.1 bacillithiol biosynthesis cysteine-adding enzyme BshC [Amphibacillus marinus]